MTDADTEAREIAWSCMVRHHGFTEQHRAAVLGEGTRLDACEECISAALRARETQTVEACANAICEFCRKGVPLIRPDAHKCDCGHCSAMAEAGGKPLGSRCLAAALRVQPTLTEIMKKLGDDFRSALAPLTPKEGTQND